jgi:hypothetical protein
MPSAMRKQFGPFWPPTQKALDVKEIHRLQIDRAIGRK